MHTSSVHTATAPYGLTQMAAPQSDRIPGKSRSDHAPDLVEVLDRVTINRTRSSEGHPSIEQTYGKSASSPAHLAKAEEQQNPAQSPFGALVAELVQNRE